MKTAICVTTRGNAHVVAESIESAMTTFANQGQATVAIVSADLPTDDAARILRDLADRLAPYVRLEFNPGCTRGAGRQRALEMAFESDPTVVVQCIDTDMIYHHPLDNVFQAFLDSKTDHFVQGIGWNACRATTMRALGPWPSWQVMEDRAIWRRAYKKGILTWIPIDCTEHIRQAERTTRTRHLARRIQYASRLAGHPGLRHFNLLKMKGIDAMVPEWYDHKQLTAAHESYWAQAGASPRRTI